MNATISLAPAGTPRAVDPLDKMRQQARDLESVFLNTLMKEMFLSIDTEGDFGGGFAEETWRGLQAEQFADSLSAAGGIGLADALVADLFAIQQAAHQ